MLTVKMFGNQTFALSIGNTKKCLALFVDTVSTSIISFVDTVSTCYIEPGDFGSKLCYFCPQERVRFIQMVKDKLHLQGY